MIVRAGSFLTSLAAHVLFAGAVLIAVRGEGGPAVSLERPDVTPVTLSLRAEGVPPRFGAGNPERVSFVPPPPAEPEIEHEISPPAPPFRGVEGPLARRRPSAARASAPASASSADEATTRPKALASNPPPSYPEAARRLGYEGKVLLRVAVSPEGNASDVGVLESSGHPVLDAAATEAVRRWRFQPARRAETTVAASLDIAIRFRLTDH